MAVDYNHRIPSDGLKFHITQNDPRSWDGINFEDRAQKLPRNGTNRWANTEVGSFLSNYTTLTYLIWITYDVEDDGFQAPSPFSKYSGTSNASVRLYQFGNGGGTRNPRFSGYYTVSKIDGSQNIWGSSASYPPDVGDTFLFSLQMDIDYGVRAAANGIQRGNIVSTGYNSTEYVFGLNNTDNMRVDPDTDFCRVHALSIYDRYISDEEVVEYFNNTKQQYKL